MFRQKSFRRGLSIRNPIRTAVLFTICCALNAVSAAEPDPTPILRLETGMHMKRINRIGIDAAERFLLTASHDKTLRLWDLRDGNLLHVYRPPIGADNEGELYSAAISPDGGLVAGAGWSGYAWDRSNSIYLFERASGHMLRRLEGLANVVFHLCFSPDGRYLGANEGWSGIRVWDTADWRLVLHDTDYDSYSDSCEFTEDNRLVTSSNDGFVRLYTPGNGFFTRSAKVQLANGLMPSAVVLSPDGEQVAVGTDGLEVVVLDARRLTVQDTLEADENAAYFLTSVAWSPDGQFIYAGGGGGTVLRWPVRGGNYAVWDGPTSVIFDIRALSSGRVAYGAFDPAWAMFDGNGEKILEQVPANPNFGFSPDTLLLSADARRIQFSFEQYGERPGRFDLNSLKLNVEPAPDSSLQAPDRAGLDIRDWEYNDEPKLDGKVLPLDGDAAYSFAVTPDKSGFLLGTSRYLRLFDKNGRQLWQTPAPAEAWSVNVSGDGLIGLAAFADGTLRWYRLADGVELLALFPHNNGRDWVLWTPSGYYVTSGQDADKLIGWHVNRNKDQEALFYPISALYEDYKRPDIIQKILQTLDEQEAVIQANAEDNREYAGDVQTLLNQAETRYRLTPEPSGLGKAVLVAASGEYADNTLFPYSNAQTQEMYRYLHQIGFTDGDVLYLNPYPPVIPADGYTDTGRQDFSLRSARADFEQAIARAAQDLQAGQQFVLYLHGHARRDAIRIGRAEELEATELRDLLAKIPAGVEQIIILETCYSGSFLDELKNVPGRVVVTAADADSLAWNTATGGFSELFIKRLKRGTSLREAFDYTVQKLAQEPEIYGAQAPQLDDNGDGVFNTQDGGVAAEIHIGGAKIHAALPPEIIDIHPRIQLAPGQQTATLWVKTIPDLDAIRQVRAVLLNETDKPAEYRGDNTDFTRRELLLSPNRENNRFEAEYDAFHTARDWRILYQAQDLDGEWSELYSGYAGAAAGSAGAVAPRLNAAAYRAGDTLTLSVDLQGELSADLYVGIVYPQGYFQTILQPLNLSLVNVLQPYQTAVRLSGAQTLNILSLSLPPLAPGTYQICGLLTPPGADPWDGSGWLSFACAGFEFN